ncbi:MAG: tRNA (adenosine(37)-N6)-dimethylallyltransferase MiaA [Prevotellaceae bacterium]|jgi:tRNA dimethylallyltransferase|nr:tRNA (adenosine(37)-N6)-dimethylallyltransferase MiaA [Prevotellaceae bacterium]
MPTFIVLLGPTGVGKTDISIDVARRLGTEIVSGDSRQIYREMRIGTAAPTPEQLAAAPHHFVLSHSVHERYTAGKYEMEALSLLDKLIAEHKAALMVGGSGLYIDAVCHGIDAFPEVDPALRATLMAQYKQEGLDPLRQQLKLLDKESYLALDMKNPRRIIRALEVTLATGKPYSSFKKEHRQPRPFRIVKIGLQRPREALYERINRRTVQMMNEGWFDEARSLYPFRHLPALNTVGYKELFDHFDGKAGLDDTIALIQQHTRNYAKKQYSYWRRYNDIRWMDASEPEKIVSLCLKLIE